MNTFKSALRWIAPSGIFKQLEQRQQSSRQQKLFIQIIPIGSLVFDIGANVGNRITALRQCSAKVVAVEPQPDCVARLKRTYGKQIIVVQAAVGATIGKLPLRLSDRLDTVASMSSDFIVNAQNTNRFGARQWDRQIEVDVITLDQLIAEYGVPSFIKIDVEGYEYEVMRGLSQQVSVLSFEWVPTMPEVTLRCIDYLDSLGMHFFQFSFYESMALSHSKSLDAGRAKQMVSLLCEERELFGDIYASCQPIIRN